MLKNYYAVEKDTALTILKNMFFERTGENFSSGAYSGALRNFLEKDPEVISPQRAYYQLVNSHSFIDYTISTYKESIQKINDITNMGVTLDVDTQQEELIKLLRETNNYLNKTLTKLIQIKSNRS